MTSRKLILKIKLFFGGILWMGGICSCSSVAPQERDVMVISSKSPGKCWHLEDGGTKNGTTVTNTEDDDS